MAVLRIWLGGIMAAWAVAFFLLALRFDKPLNAFDSGASAFPMLISASLFVTAVWMMLQESRRLRGSEPVKLKRSGAIAVSAGVVALYAAIMPYVGYYLATLVFVPTLLAVNGERRWRWIVLITVVLLLFNYLAFDRLLGVSLPRFGAAFVQ